MKCYCRHLVFIQGDKDLPEGLWICDLVFRPIPIRGT
jgi:hypothetical protein